MSNSKLKEKAAKFIKENHPDPDIIFSGTPADIVLHENIISLMANFHLHQLESISEEEIDKLFPIKTHSDRRMTITVDYWGITKKIIELLKSKQ